MSRTSWRRPLAGLVSAAALTATAIAGTTASPATAADATTAIQILSFNDFHGALESPSSGNGGVLNLSTLVQQEKATNANTVVAGAGDLIGATPLLSAAFHDEPTIEAMNALGLDVSSVGNHEFDEGRVELTRMRYGSQAGGNGCHPADGCQDGDAFGGSAFPYLAANVIDDLTGQPVFQPTYVRELSGVKVGFIGMTLEGTPEIVSPSGVAGLTFLDEADTANKYAAQLQAQGVQTIVVLLHEGGLPASTSDPNSCAVSGAITDIVNRMNPAIDTVVSGHTHQAYICTINNKLVTSAGVSARFLTDIDLTVDTATGDVVTQTGRNIAAALSTPDDTCLVPIIDKYKSAIAPIANRVVGKISADITRTANAAGESALGDVIADGQLDATSAADKGGAVAAFMNPGGIRANLTYAQSKSEGDGNVTFEEMFTVQPFGNNLVTLTLTGAQIDAMLEQQFDNPTAGQNRILQVSRTVTYTYDASKPKGEKVDIASIRINGTPIVATQSYRITVNSFLADGGDGFSVLRQGTNRLGGAVDTDAFEDYFEAHPTGVTPGPQNRITMVGSAPSPSPSASASPSPSPTASTTASATPSPSPSATAPPRTCSAVAPQGGSAASVTLSLSHQQITAGNTPRLSGTVLDATGRPVAGTDLVVLGKSWGESTYQAIGTPVRPAADGTVTTSVRPSRQTTYVVRAGTLRQSGNVTVFVHRRVEIQLPRTSRIANPVRIEGYVVPAESVRFGVGMLQNGRFTYLSEGVTTAGGRFGTEMRLPRGDYALVVYTSARQGVLAGSRSVRLNVVG